MRKLKIGRILTLFVVLILVVTASVYCIRTFFRQDEIIEEKSYYDLDLFSMENGWMTYKDSSYKSLTGIDVSSHNQYIDAGNDSEAYHESAYQGFQYISQGK